MIRFSVLFSELVSLNLLLKTRTLYISNQRMYLKFKVVPKSIKQSNCTVRYIQQFKFIVQKYMV